MKGKRKRGKQKKGYEDNIKDWTGMNCASSARAAGNRARWKGHSKVIGQDRIEMNRIELYN